MLPRDRDRIRTLLDHDVTAARRRFHYASDQLDHARRPTTSAYPSVQREERIRLTSHAYGIAAQELRTALERLHNLIHYGIMPPDLAPKPANKKDARSIAAKQSA